MRFSWICAAIVFLHYPASLLAQTLEGTRPLEMKGDLARVMLDGIDRYLTKATKEAESGRQKFWHRDFSSGQAYEKSVRPNRERLKKILGVVDERLPVNELEFVATTGQGSLVAETDQYRIQAVRWPVLPGVHGEGLLLEPKGKVRACVVVIPDADQTPEVLAGFDPKSGPPQQIACRLAELGCLVIVPTLVDRQDTYSGNPRIHRWTNQPHREFVYRMAYEMGRHIIGYEVQKVLAAVDWFAQREDRVPIGVWGYGEGGLLALYSGAIDTRIASTGVDACFQPREKLYDEPIYRNVWGLLKEFGDAELAALIAPRHLSIAAVPGPVVKGPPAPRPGRAGAAPGELHASFGIEAVEHEYRRALDLSFTKLFAKDHVALNLGPMVAPTGGPPYFPNFLAGLGWGNRQIKGAVSQQATDLRKSFDPGLRQKRQFDELVDYTQKLLPISVQKREEFFWKKLDTSSLEKFQKSQEPLREYFHNEIIGRLPEPTMPLNPRTRLIYETEKWKGYEVVLDVYEDVISYGILLVPNNIKPGEKRPCVVCQHGLEGRPNDICDPKKKTVYKSYGAKLADEGFVVFAPQNPYIFDNDFRQVVRKANPLQLTLYAFIFRQHQRILEFLGTLPFVDSSRIAYYGLSYGGKVAMRIPALLLGYCLSICSGDFNEWIWKNITLDWGSSYMFTKEYEMYDLDLCKTFNYAEMAALIAPRPFMVERGHNDGVGLDEYVAFEYAKVRRLYAKLGIADRTEIEFFSGGHEIRLVGTLAFLRQHLKWEGR